MCKVLTTGAMGICMVLALIPVGCSNAKPLVADHSGDPEYMPVIGKVDFLVSESYLYRSPDGVVFIDSVDIISERVRNLMTLKAGTQVRIEKVLSEEEDVTESLYTFRCFPMVSFADPNSGERIVARTKFLYLQNSANLHVVEDRKRK